MKTILKIILTSFFSIYFMLIPFENGYAQTTSQWEILNEGSGGSLQQIDFVNEDIGWIRLTDGNLWKTEDGGENWSDISLPDGVYMIISILQALQLVGRSGIQGKIGMETYIKQRMAD